MHDNHPLPEIRITFSHLLHKGECQILDRALNDGENKIGDVAIYEEKAGKYREAWREYEDVILRGIVEALDVPFYRSVIDVTLAPYFGHKSSPLILNFNPDPDVFVDKLTHELLHVIQNDNAVYQSANHYTDKKLDLSSTWRELYGTHDQLTLVHIPLHALHKYIYLDILRDPARLKRELTSLEASHTAAASVYLAAWDYVNQQDYHEMIEPIRAIYRS